LATRFIVEFITNFAILSIRVSNAVLDLIDGVRLTLKVGSQIMLRFTLSTLSGSGEHLAVLHLIWETNIIWLGVDLRVSRLR
jgi:hypothetical protein